MCTQVRYNDASDMLVVLQVNHFYPIDTVQYN